MAKSDTPFDRLELSRAYAPPHQPEWAREKPVNGFDTETADGDVIMLSGAYEGFGGFVAHNDGEMLPPEDMWQYLTHTRARGAINVWYNLDFDTDVILKSVLNRKQMAVLTVNNTVTVPLEAMDGGDFKWRITYIPGKFMKIKDSNKHVYTHYDASQFFFSSLEVAAQEWLGEKKLSDTVDVKQFGKKGDQVNDYIRAHWDKIETYARKDAVLVRDLWQEAIEVGEELGIPMGRPFSTGYLGESYLNAHLKEKPGIGPYDMAKMAWEAYAGGRFEVIKRGDIGPVAGPDINSAYPAIIANLPDPKTLVWDHTENPTVQDLKDADYGFVHATISTDETRPIQPFAVKDTSDDKLKYPALVNHEVTCLKEIFTNAHEHDYLDDYMIHEAWLGHDNGAHYPFDFIPGLYDDRKTFADQGKKKTAMLLKIILNSMYGKFCQTTPKRRKLTDATELEDHEYFVSSLSLPKYIRDEYTDGFIEYLQAGSWFNPFLAAYTTGLTRLELHKRILEYGLEPYTVMLATDCLMIEQDAFESSNFATDLVPGENVSYEDQLGMWDYDYKGDAFVIGAGIYQVDKADGSSKVQTRGFKEVDLDATDLRHEAKQADGYVEIESTRPRSMSEAIWMGQDVSDIGQFIPPEDNTRKLHPDMDSKRQWGQKATFDRLLSGTQKSQPIVLRG